MYILIESLPFQITLPYYAGYPVTEEEAEALNDQWQKRLIHGLHRLVRLGKGEKELREYIDSFQFSALKKPITQSKSQKAKAIALQILESGL